MSRNGMFQTFQPVGQRYRRAARLALAAVIVLFAPSVRAGQLESAGNLVRSAQQRGEPSRPETAGALRLPARPLVEDPQRRPDRAVTGTATMPATRIAAADGSSGDVFTAVAHDEGDENEDEDEDE
ncbi:MAG: hypothetical protein ACC645_23195, partial [Pirellulales bacterium]